MTGFHDVVGALLAPGETAQPPEGAERVKAVFPPGDQLVGVALMSHVPDDLVMGGTEHSVEGQGQLYDAEVGSQMAAVLADHLHDDSAYLSGKILQLRERQTVQFLRAGNRIEDLRRRHTY